MAGSKTTHFPGWIQQWSSMGSEEENRRYSMSDVRLSRNGDTPVPHSTKTASSRRTSGWHLMNDRTTPIKSSDGSVGRQRATVLFDTADGGQLVVSYDAPDPQQRSSDRREALGVRARRTDDVPLHPPAADHRSSTQWSGTAGTPVSTVTATKMDAVVCLVKAEPREDVVTAMDVQRSRSSGSSTSKKNTFDDTTTVSPVLLPASSDDMEQAGLNEEKNQNIGRLTDDAPSKIAPSTAASGLDPPSNSVRKLPENLPGAARALCTGNGRSGVERRRSEKITGSVPLLENVNKQNCGRDEVFSADTGSATAMFKIPLPVPVLKRNSTGRLTSVTPSSAPDHRLSKAQDHGVKTSRLTAAPVIGRSLMMPSVTSLSASKTKLMSSALAPSSATKNKPVKDETEKPMIPTDQSSLITGLVSSDNLTSRKHNATFISVRGITSSTSSTGTASTAVSQRRSGAASLKGRDVKSSASLSSDRTAPALDKTSSTSIGGGTTDAHAIVTGLVKSSSGKPKVVKRVGPPAAEIKAISASSSTSSSKRTSGTTSVGRLAQLAQPTIRLMASTGRMRGNADVLGSANRRSLKLTTTRTSGTMNVGSIAKLKLANLLRQDQLEESPSPLVSPLSPSCCDGKLSDQPEAFHSTSKDRRKKWDLCHHDDADSMVKASLYDLARRVHDKMTSLAGAEKNATDLSDDEVDDVDAEELPQWKTSDPYLAGIMRRLQSVEQHLSTMTTRTLSESETRRSPPVHDRKGTVTADSLRQSDTVTSANVMLLV